ncbi:membrane alanyl aminopeptidase-like isoform X2 [Plodia interpunctella]|uniref:membrane alanyl aminopeptidase-like isoform X2 n=1 Tax=Plodia interpunctella TaxID=58824 RepID=UPI002368389B|nr:membrane alanyl aminopeptidase-like isoform X2 [Plodia interpunctella]
MRTIIFNLLAILVLSESLPIRNIENETVKVVELDLSSVDVEAEEVNKTELTRVAKRNSIRPGLVVTRYSITLEPDVNSGVFNGIAEIDVNIIDINTREDDIIFNCEGLEVHSVNFRIGGGSVIFDPENFWVDGDENQLFIETGRIASLYTFSIEYSGSLELAGVGLFTGIYPGNTYVAMNLHPTNARRVFPCMDEPTEASTISFTFNNLNYNHLVGNSMLVENSQNTFVSMMGPPNIWGMIAHNFESMLVPTPGVQVYGRTGLTNQDAQAVAINFFYNTLNTWTNKEYLEIDVNQDGRMVILALPDVDTEWSALSTVAIWEPYVVMATQQSVKQRSIALVKVAEAMARQWFGYVIYPENWRYEWVISGLGSYAAWEILREFQEMTGGATDVSLLDVNTLFVTEVIQESLIRDASLTSRILEPNEDIFDIGEIREHRKSVKYKSLALMRMLKLILGGDDQDFIQIACQSLLNSRSLQTVNAINFYDAINSEFGGNEFIEDVEEYMEQWLKNTGYPSIFVSQRSGGLVLTQERFSYTSLPQRSFRIPITYTTSIDPNFDNIHPEDMSDGTLMLDMNLGEEDWVIFNIQGQGYYRVNYADDLWEQLIEALNDPDQREVIHPLNRGTLVDDSLNLARANRLGYDVAFWVVLTMEHETSYAPWKAFVRNMDFLRKRLVALVTEDEDLDPDIYLRMVRRTIGRVENELGFYPDPKISEPAMDSLTRGLVMDHACRANYQPCIAAAVDWFYGPNTNDEPTVNPDIPQDIRPAVYCTMVREGDNTVIEALERRLEIEPTQYERVVILESLGCSRDMDYINVLLESTIASDSPYMVEERVRILSSVIESSYENALVALNFISRRTNEIREMYGGAERLEEMIFLLASNMANDFLATEFNNWRSDRNNALGDSQEAADKAYDLIVQNLAWDALHMDFVYEWIDENDGRTVVVSMFLMCLTAFFALFNH